MKYSNSTTQSRRLFLQSSYNVIVRVGLCLGLVMLSACVSAPALMPTPNIYTQAGHYAVENVNSAYQNNRADVLYVTDRAANTNEKDGLIYGADRSPSVAFGSTQVQIGKDVPWHELVATSESAKRHKHLKYKVISRNQLGRFPPTPHPFTVDDGETLVSSDVLRLVEEQSHKFKGLIRERLELSKAKDVVLFIHGFNTSFDDAVFVLAGIWHFLERQGVPLLYSWPAKHGGLAGYFVDRESGEFTIYHLKETLRILFSMPEVENIHIISHSRGTDVMTSALRELVIEFRAAGRDPRREFRVANLILAAPDLDYGVITQRLIAEKFGTAFGQITIYTAKSDKALGLSQWIMKGIRFGRLKSTEIDESERSIFREVGNVNVIEILGVKGFRSHGSFHSNPAASSDLIRVIRHQAAPGESLRPLTHNKDNFWQIRPDYPAIRE